MRREPHSTDAHVGVEHLNAVDGPDSDVTTIGTHDRNPGGPVRHDASIESPTTEELHHPRLGEFNVGPCLRFRRASRDLAGRMHIGVLRVPRPTISIAVQQFDGCTDGCDGERLRSPRGAYDIIRAWVRQR